MKRTKPIKVNQINDIKSALNYLQKVLKWQAFCKSHKSIAKAIKYYLKIITNKIWRTKIE